MDHLANSHARQVIADLEKENALRGALDFDPVPAEERPDLGNYVIALVLGATCGGGLGALIWINPLKWLLP